MSEDPRLEGETAEGADQRAEGRLVHQGAEPDAAKHEAETDSALPERPSAEVTPVPEMSEPVVLYSEMPESVAPQPQSGPPVFYSNGNGFDGPLLVSAPPEPLPVVQTRAPNVLDATLFLILLIAGAVVSSALLGAALYFHWLDKLFGVHGLDAAAKSTPVELGLELVIYLIGIGIAVPLFRMIWHKSFFSGVHWHGATAARLRYLLFGVAVICNLLAIVGNWLLPFPQHAPIDKLFGTTTDAWILACFGVLIAPFFEELIFRGFLLPAIATAWDWMNEKMTHELPRPLDAAGNPVWSVGAMVFAALLVSAPFAAMHAPQVGNAWGPVMLLYCISLILCAVRLKTRSLAASTLVHASYNFLLFAVMFAETGGFRHLDKL
ncbi:CPBP family intramembrane glutamic endopeptidase [Acidicapsa dinghuensis]|uniref:CPBP family intramembrane glutamic endopeptidase n=1 Tax=Acidicapsa dinghuensis TaxID=2218256 RepID=A0ABW1EG69_9BACT|nr:type II CAAX endopeptidase family protein [Acidicapsa dinghuensis]